MADSFIIFTPNPPSISTLTSSGKQSQWTKIQKNLEKILENYKKNDFINQELNIFDIIDKPFGNMSHNHFLKIIKKLVEKIKDEIKEYNLKPESITFSSSDNATFNITYKKVFSLANIIMYILDNITSKGKLADIVYDFAFKGIMPKFKDISISKQQISKVLAELDSMKVIRICLYKENEDIYSNNENKKSINKNMKNLAFKMDSKIILLFSLFYKAFFKSIIGAIIDLNIPPIDNFFTTNINPYLINEEHILYLGNYYKDIIICNLILIKSLPNFTYLSNINIKMYDSYQLELHNVLTNILVNSDIDDLSLDKVKKRSKTLSQHATDVKNRHNTEFLEDKEILFSPKFNNNYLYIQHLLASSQTNIYDLCIDFNSLDPLLFNSVNYLLAKFNKLSKLNLILFPHNKINKRKIFLNNIFYKKFSNIDDEYYSMDDKKIYYQYIDQNENSIITNNYILKD